MVSAILEALELGSEAHVTDIHLGPSTMLMSDAYMEALQQHACKDLQVDMACLCDAAAPHSLSLALQGCISWMQHFCAVILT